MESLSSITKPILYENQKPPWIISLIKAVAWLVLLLGLIGAPLSAWYFQVFLFTPQLSIDPFGFSVVMVFFFSALIGFPVLKAFAFIAETVNDIKTKIQRQTP